MSKFLDKGVITYPNVFIRGGKNASCYLYLIRAVVLQGIRF